MAVSRPSRAIAATYGEQQIQANLDQHIADQSNPHATKLAQLSDLVTTGASAGYVPTLQNDGTYALAAQAGSAGGAPVGTAIPLSNAGTGTAGFSTSASREDHKHPVTSLGIEDSNLLGWTVDPQFGSGTLTMTAGTIYLAKIKVAKTSVITNVVVPISTGGTGVTSSYVVIYDLNNNQLGISADQGTSWVAAGTKTVALSSPTLSQAAGTLVWVGILAVGGSPVIRALPNAPTVNTGLSRYAVLTGQTTPPATLSGQAASTTPTVLFIS